MATAYVKHHDGARLRNNSKSAPADRDSTRRTEHMQRFWQLLSIAKLSPALFSGRLDQTIPPPALTSSGDRLELEAFPGIFVEASRICYYTRGGLGGVFE